MGLVLLCAGSISQADNNQQSLEQLKGAIKSLQKELSGYRDKQSNLQKQLKTSEIAIGKLSRQISTNQRELKQLERELVSLKQRRRELEVSRAEQQALIADQVRIAYQLGREQTLKVILNQEDPAKLSRAMAYVNYFNDARMTRIAAFNNTIEELNQIEPEILATRDRIASTASTLKKRKERLSAEHKSRKQTLARLDETIRSKNAELKQRENDRKRLEALLNTVEDFSGSFATAEEVKPFSSRKGKMRLPTKGKVVNRFGARRSTGGLRWQGIEIRASEGSTVKAIHHGRVVFADWFRGQGLLIIIDHGDGYMSLYAHNQSLLRQTGDWVQAGEPLATVGSSGGQSQNALYFEIRHNGKPTNPMAWCRT